MKRRFHVPRLRTGFVDLDEAEAHHARDVLRLPVGTMLELFDDRGQLATGPLVMVNASVVRVEVKVVEPRSPGGLELTVAACIPKGDRADWMIEKLSELGVHRFVPLAAQRSVVLPGGRNKLERWARIALESAKQSHRPGTMQIQELTALDAAIQLDIEGAAWCLSTAPDAIAIANAVADVQSLGKLTLLIGPEGGWADEELARFRAMKITPVMLTTTILRIETAAITAAAAVLCARA